MDQTMFCNRVYVDLWQLHRASKMVKHVQWIVCVVFWFFAAVKYWPNTLFCKYACIYLQVVYVIILSRQLRIFCFNDVGKNYCAKFNGHIFMIMNVALPTTNHSAQFFTPEYNKKTTACDGECYTRHEKCYVKSALRSWIITPNQILLYNSIAAASVCVNVSNCGVNLIIISDYVCPSG